ncbi:carotenoid oxygenase family protein [Streptomyces sp. NPDC056944]|uniref:carotenoid oxygenase family protein n=1 Tax=Streptomyces sp. NPDC056944 TaxID=3345972 RepID=UPI0036371BA5
MALVPRDGGAPVWSSDLAFWMWHSVDAYEDGPEPQRLVGFDASSGTGSPSTPLPTESARPPLAWSAPEPGPDASSEDHGHSMTFATDRTDNTSWFLDFLAGDPASGPGARVSIPVRVPLGLHGAWLPTEEP